MKQVIVTVTVDYDGDERSPEDVANEAVKVLESHFSGAWFVDFTPLEEESEDIDMEMY